MTLTNEPRPRAAMLLPLLMWLAGCASTLPASSVAPALIPPLPAQARQPPAPAWCSPTCSAALTAERESWLRLLTPPAAPGLPASAVTKP